MWGNVFSERPEAVKCSINPLHDYQLIERGHAYDQSAGKRTVRSWAEESWGSALLQQPPLWVPGTPRSWF